MQREKLGGFESSSESIDFLACLTDDSVTNDGDVKAILEVRKM